MPTSASPAAEPATLISPAGGTELTITGSGFGGPYAFASVTFCPPGTTDLADADGRCKEGLNPADTAEHVVPPESDTVLKVIDPGWDIASNRTDSRHPRVRAGAHRRRRSRNRSMDVA